MKSPFPLFTPGILAAGLLFVRVPMMLADDTTTAPVAPADVAHLHYLAAGKPEVQALLMPPPLPGTPEQAADMSAVQSVYHAAGSNEMAAAYSEKKFSIYNFTPAVGSFFTAGKFPKTEAFFDRVQTDAETVTDNAKLVYKRPRPFMTDPSLANGKLEKSFSYPSGHATESMVLALILAELFPDRHDAIIATARDIGWHRVQIARHYPTDIYAGRILAQAIVREMKNDPGFQSDLAAAKTEIAAGELAVKH